MENIQLLIEAMEYIEDNLSRPLKTDTIADHLHCSKSTIEKLFRYINNISIRDLRILFFTMLQNELSAEYKRQYSIT